MGIFAKVDSPGADNALDNYLLAKPAGYEGRRLPFVDAPQVDRTSVGGRGFSDLRVRNGCAGHGDQRRQDCEACSA
jgi:hypothetical protein